ncbi:MAG: hypothetical protein EOO88_38385 [Pedobacter sp.]|nr:MAG: hypothetical protein EOO88_38385 [Pedobacter sp.]
MEEFVVKYRISLREYAEFAFRNTYKNKQVITTFIIGLIALMIYVRVPEGVGPSSTMLCAGIGLILFPVIQIGKTLIKVRNKLSFKEKLTYRVGVEGITIEGAAFNANYKWVDFVEKSDSADFFILYVSQTEGVFLRKASLNNEQKTYVWSKIDRSVL